MYKKLYSRFLSAHPNEQHYAAHSHHYWPDVTREAMSEYWDDACRLVDDKWEYFFSVRVPATQRLISQTLNIRHPEQIVFAPNTHELLVRVLSCFAGQKKIRILSTDSEFYSFTRQIRRLSEIAEVEIELVSTQNFSDFEERFLEKVKTTRYDLIFISHVFFNSGVVVQNLERLVEATPTETVFMVDGYHGFMAVPTDLSAIQDRVFYLGGSYKYAQGGEGCCFMTVPKGSGLRPLYTGWFANFENLNTESGARLINPVKYSDSGMRFAGSTMDFSALYRLQSVLELFHQHQITVPVIHQDVQNKQKNFLEEIQKLNHELLKVENILHNGFDRHGHFFSFELQKPELAEKLHRELRQQGIVTDYRSSRLRFGFAIYQDERIRFT